MIVGGACVEGWADAWVAFIFFLWLWRKSGEGGDLDIAPDWGNNFVLKRWGYHGIYFGTVMPETEIYVRHGRLTMHIPLLAFGVFSRVAVGCCCCRCGGRWCCDCVDAVA